MTLSASFIWKNSDSTKDLNARLKNVVLRGVVFGGEVLPGSVGLNVTVEPSVAVSFDGMTVVENAQVTLPVAANTNQYIVCWAKYNEGGVPAAPTLQWKVYDEATYLAHAEKDYLIVYARVNVPPAVTSVIANYIYFDVRDETDPVTRDWYRGRVANPAALPAPPPHMNRVGDFYFVDSDHTFYFWNGTIWEPLNTGSYNTETSFMNKYMADMEQARFVEGSGVIAGIRPNTQGDFASDTEINIIETPTVTDQIGIDAFTAIVNGHRVQTHAQYLALGPKPGLGDEYDLVYLEVWREAITVPDTFNYDRNPDGASTYTLQEAEDKLEKLEWKAGIPVAPTADNFNLNPAEPYDHDWRMVKWRIAVSPNMPSSICLYNPSDPTITGACEDFEGNPTFTSQPAGTGTDDRLWISGATTAADGHSWAIPLFVIRRTNAEVPPNAVKIFRDGVRYVFPVYPITDVAHSARKALDTLYRSEPTPFTFDHYPYDEPSGFLSSMDFQIETKAGSNNVSVYEDQTHARIRGIDDWIKLAGGPQVVLNPAPAPINSWERQLVYLKMSVTLYDNGTGTSTANQFVSQKHRPYIPSSLAGSVRAQGWKRGYVTFEYVSEDLGWNYLDEYDAMTAAGWTRGDLSMASKNAQYEDGGIWSRAVAIDADDRIHPYLMEWAIPICLIHRRNQSAWAFDTNPNGSSGRPDGRTNHAWIYPDDLVDLRHEVGLTETDIKARLDADVDRLMKGQLRTRLANKYRGAGIAGVVAGSKILQTDSIGIVAGTYQLTAPDGVRGIWSDAKEFFPVSVSFDLLSSSSGPLYDYVYNGGLNEGTLKIRAPGYVGGAPPTADATIVRHLPAFTYVDGDSSSATFLEYLGPPCWTTQEDRPLKTSQPSPVSAKFVDPSGTRPIEGDIAFKYYPDTTKAYGGQSFVVTGKNVLEKAVEMTGIVNTLGLNAGTKAVLSWWVHYDRSFTGSEYASNYGLSEIPDKVYSVIKNPGGVPETLNVGPIYTTVRTTFSASDTTTITAAAVSAASGLPGTVVLCGVDPYSFRSNVTGTPVPLSIRMNNARDTITIQLTGAATALVDYTVFFYTSQISKWVEIGKGGKSIQAELEWCESGEVNLGAAPTGNYAWDLGNKTWRGPSLGGRVTFVPMFWTRATSGTGDWYWVNFISTLPGYENSNLLSFDLGAGVFSQYALFITAALTPLDPADKMVVHYDYTPYQGLSTEGGNVAILGTAAPKLLELLHGRIEGHTDFYATQSGACSYYSGVDSWSGYTPNFVISSYAGAMGRGTFEHYVVSSLVKPTPAGGGVQDLTPNGNDTNAAAIYRLPFPINYQMFSGSNTYHLGVMDFDLDPGRVGASAGYRSYAPSYEPIRDATAPYVSQPNQFINSITPLATNDDNLKEESIVICASDYQIDDLTTGVTFRNFDWRIDDTQEGRFYFDARVRGFGQVRKIQTRAALAEFLDIASMCQLTDPSGGNAAVTPIIDHLYLDSVGAHDRKLWTSITDLSALVSPVNLYLDFFPGTIIEYHTTYASPRLDRLQPFLKFHIDNNKAGTSEFLRLTNVVIDANDIVFKETGFCIGKQVDLIRIPFDSYCTKRSTAYNVGTTVQETGFASGRTSLIGLEVKFPDSWTPGMKAVALTLLHETNDGLGHGRGLYLGTGGYRFNMPVFLPGSGTPLNTVLGDIGRSIDYGTEQPESVPYMPGAPLFKANTRYYYEQDHGGPMAYCFFGASIRPSADNFKNSVVMQVSGGPTGGVSANFLGYTPNDLHGTAIDAFWPTGRPILKSRK